MGPVEPAAASAKLAEEIADRAAAAGLTVACAESLTGGHICTVLAAAPGSGSWFRGGVVAYSAEVKFEVLGVPRGPVVTRECAQAMAAGVRRLLRADVTLSVTGVGGPGEEEGQPAGTVWTAVLGPGFDRAEVNRFAGRPPDIVRSAGLRALELLREAVGRTESGPRPLPPR